MTTLALQAVVLVVAALLLGRLLRLLGLPDLLGMIAAGVLVGAWMPSSPDVFDLDDVAGPVRLAVLAVVLLRAGLGISRSDLSSAGPLALRMGILPMLGDALLVTCGGMFLFDLDPATATALGFLVAAISPAIVIPGMLDLLEGRSGRSRRVPVALVAGAPLDVILATVAFGVALDVALAGDASWGMALTALPLRVGGGLVLGAVAGLIEVGLGRMFPAMLRGLRGGLLLWVIAGGLIHVADQLGVSFVVAIVTLGFVVRDRAGAEVDTLSDGLGRIWQVVQVALFGLIGAAVDLGPLAAVGLAAVAVIVLGQAGRALGALLATARSGLERGERLSCVLGYVPKATIQAAFAGLGLDRGLPDGGVLLSVGVLAIVLTAPVGVVAIHRGIDALLGPRDEVA